MGARGTAMRDSSVEESTLQLVLDQIEELVVTIIEEVRERPGVALAIVAGLVGALLGARAAAGLNRRRAGPPAPAQGAVRSVRRVGDMAELVGLGVRLLQNPIVRALLLAAMERQLKRRLSM
jgi:hypothetical protein